MQVSATTAKSPVFAYIAMSFILSICFAIKEMGWLARRGKARAFISRSVLGEAVSVLRGRRQVRKLHQDWESGPRSGTLLSIAQL